MYTVLVPGARATYSCGWKYKDRLVASCVLSGYFIHVQSRSPPAAPRVFCLHGAIRRPIPSPPLSADTGQVVTEMGSPDPFKSRRPPPRRAFTRRTRFQAAITVPEGANQTLRVCSLYYSIVPYIPGRQSIPSERTGPISVHETPLPAPCSPPQEI